MLIISYTWNKYKPKFEDLCQCKTGQFNMAIYGHSGVPMKWRASNQFVCNQGISQGQETRSKYFINTIDNECSRAHLQAIHLSTQFATKKGP